MNKKILTIATIALAIDQITKVNGKNTDKNTILKNGDKTEFYIAISNLKEKQVEVNITDYIHQYWNNVNIKLIKDNQEYDITNEFKDNNLISKQKIDAKGKIYIVISAVFNNTNLSQDVAIHTINIADLSYYGTYSSNTELKILKPDDGKLNINVVQTANPKDKSTIKSDVNYFYNNKIINKNI